MNGEALMNWMANEGISQRELAKKLGVTHSTVYRMVHGHKVSEFTLRRVHEISKLPYDVLIGDQK